MSHPNEPADEQLDDVAEAWGVAHILAALSEVDAVAPSTSTREALLGHISTTPRELVAPMAASDLYISRVRAMHALLADLAEPVWLRTAAPYKWTVHGLIAHLLVIEQYTAVQFGLAVATGESPTTQTDDHLAMGADQISAELRDSPTSTMSRWAAAADRIVDHVQSRDFRVDRPVTLHGWPFSGSSALVARAFELWTHTEDIRRAAGLPRESTAAAELRTMSSYSVASLPFLWPTVASDLRLTPTRVVLTGAGGGTYDLGGAGERTALLVADVLEYCRVVARRVEPGDLPATIEGNATLVNALLDASRAFAV